MVITCTKWKKTWKLCDVNLYVSGNTVRDVPSERDVHVGQTALNDEKTQALSIYLVMFSATQLTIFYF